MKAAFIMHYGGNEIVQVGDMPMPNCKPGALLITVHTASVNPLDWKIRSGALRIATGCTYPIILGSECAGEVAESGSGSLFKKGDRVIGLAGMRKPGAFAEYVCLPEKTTFAKPESISFDEAACLPIAGLTALQALRDLGGIASGKKVLINGASGGVGTFAVQIAKIFGAEATGVCSEANAGLVKALGADRVIDYRENDFTQERYRYDIVFDAVAKKSFGACANVLEPHGTYISTLPSISILMNQYVLGYLTGKKARTIWVKPNSTDIAWMIANIEAGKIKVIIDKVFSLDETQKALAYSESGRAKGKIVLRAI